MSKPQRLLIIDDDSDVTGIAKMALESAGAFEVSVLSDSTRAVETVIQENPDLIVMDVHMPEADGPTTLTALRMNARTSHVPVIFITAGATDELVDRLVLLGALGVLEKPFDPFSLGSAITEIQQSPHDENRIAGKREFAPSRISELRALFRFRLSDSISQIENFFEAIGGSAGVITRRELSI